MMELWDDYTWFGVKIEDQFYGVGMPWPYMIFLGAIIALTISFLITDQRKNKKQNHL